MKKKTEHFQDIDTLRNMTKSDLAKEDTRARKELYTLQMKHVANELKQPHLIKAHRKYIARISTVATTL